MRRVQIRIRSRRRQTTSADPPTRNRTIVRTWFSDLEATRMLPLTFPGPAMSWVPADAVDNAVEVTGRRSNRQEARPGRHRLRDRLPGWSRGGRVPSRVRWLGSADWRAGSCGKVTEEPQT